MKLILIAILATLAGCSTVGMFDNIAACSLAKDKLLVSSMYGGSFGITAVIRQEDAAVVCKP